MRIGALMIAAMLVAAGCGKDGGGGKAGGGGGPSAAQLAEQQRAEQEARDREAKRAELTQQRTELAARVQELEKAYDEMSKRHEKEVADLPDISKFRRKYSQIKADAARAQTKLDDLEKRLAELKQLAASDAAGEVRKLQEERAGVQGRYDEALSGWKKSLEEERNGAVQDSPVKRDLVLIRQLKERWFQVTPDARRGKLGDSARKTINDTFRSWVVGDEQRKGLCERILAQRIAGGDLKPETYDFTRLDFYVLLELLEDALDRANIAVEKKELKENEAKVSAIEAELDAIDDKLSLAMQAGGPEFEEYLDLQERHDGVKSLTDEVVQQAKSYGQVFEEIASVKDRQQAEAEALVKQLDEAKAAVKEKDAELRKL